jgi:hypothetical protein
LRNAIVPFALALLSTSNASALTIHATAGLSGVTRAGRWTPVQITITASPGESSTGDLVVEWGDARVAHRVSVEGGTRRDLELYIRTSDPRGVVSVRYADAGGREIARTGAPVRIETYDRELVVCVEPSHDAACSIAIEAAVLPSEWRGYDAADAIVMGPAMQLSDSQSRALTHWRELDGLNRSGVLSAVPRLPSTVPGAGTRRQARSTEAVALALTVMALAACGLFCRQPLLLFGGVLAATGVAGLAASQVGRFGAGSNLIVQHTSILLQMPDHRTARLTSRAVATFPAFDDYQLKASASDVAFERRTGRRGVRDEWIAEDGRSALAGRFAAGAREAFTIEALVDIAPVRLHASQGGITAANTSTFTLDECRWLDAAVTTSVTIGPGRTVSLPPPPGSMIPVLRCTTQALPLPLVEGGREVRASGTTQVLAALPTGEQ